MRSNHPSSDDHRSTHLPMTSRRQDIIQSDDQLLGDLKLCKETFLKGFSFGKYRVDLQTVGGRLKSRFFVIITIIFGFPWEVMKEIAICVLEYFHLKALGTNQLLFSYFIFIAFFFLSHLFFVLFSSHIIMCLSGSS